ncbi:MAG: hypothetical protein ACLT3Y_02480 [Ruminococcus callidus]
MVRFQLVSALNQNQHTGRSLTEIAADLGYFDQSHFVRFQDIYRADTEKIPDAAAGTMPLTKSCALCSKTVSLWKRETVFVVFMILRKCCVLFGTGSR